MAVARPCERCGRPLRSDAPKKQRWCGKKCSGAAHAEAALQRARAEGRARNCVRCGGVFVVNEKFRPNQQHCGRTCFFADKKEKGWVTRSCDNCGNDFTAKRSTVERTDQRFCSHPCALQGMRKCSWCNVPREHEEAFCSETCRIVSGLDEEFKQTGVLRSRCGQCGEVKLADEFHVERSNRNGLSNQCKACAQAYYVENKDAYRRRNFTKRGGADERRLPFTPAEKTLRWAMWGGRCWVCGIAEATQEDHVKPLAAGGWDCLSNLRPICGPCNARKRGAWPLPIGYEFRGYRHPNPRDGADTGFVRVGRAIATCQGCGKSWETQAHRAKTVKYRGDECRYAAQAEVTRNRRFGERRCDGCGGNFEAKTSKQRFCDHDCRLTDAARRRRAAKVGPGQQTLFS